MKLVWIATGYGFEQLLERRSGLYDVESWAQMLVWVRGVRARWILAG